MNNKILFPIFVLSFFSCGTQYKKKQTPNQITNAKKPSTSIDDKKRINSLINSAIVFGNDRAYNEVSSYYLIEDMSENFLYYAIMMANKYENPEACYHVYYILTGSSSKEPKDAVQQTDEKSKKLALFYLLRSYELGYEKAKSQIDEIFGKSKSIPKSTAYLKDF